MSWRAVRESAKRVTEQGELSVMANLRPSLMPKSSAVRMEAEAGSLQAVAVERTGIYIAAPTEGDAGRREPSVYMWRDLWYLTALEQKLPLTP